MLRVTPQLSIPDLEFSLSFARSSGPGGQNVNKTNTKVTLRWNATQSPSLPLGVRARFLQTYATKLTGEGEIVITCDQHRQQEANIAGCFDKLKTMILAVLTPPKERRPTRPSYSANVRRIQVKKGRSETKKNRRVSQED